MASMPPRARWGVRAAAATLAGAAWPLVGSLRRLSPEARERALQELSRRPGTGYPLQMVRTLVLLVAGAEREGDGLRELASSMPLARPDPPLDVTPAAEWPARTSWDAVVIGSGAGGAVSARTLARAGLRTVVVEEGRAFSSDELRESTPLERFAGLYREGGGSAAIGRPPILLPVGRAVGGTTVVNSGTCYRTPERVLLAWRDRAGLELADPDRFARHLDDAWATLGPEPVGAEVMGHNGELAIAGARALGWRSGPLQHNALGCTGCCQSAIGCPRNAKSGVNLNALPQACEAGARIVSEARVDRILRSRGRVAGVLARRLDGSPLTLLARRVVVAAGATETPPLLRRSGVAHPHLGRNLSIHPAVQTLGLFAEPVRGWDGVLQSAGIEEFHEREGILLEATGAPKGMGWTALPGYGPSLLRAIDEIDHIASLGALIADGPAGRVLGTRRPVVRYDLRPRDGARLVRALWHAGRALLAAGAEEILPGLSGGVRVRDERGLREALERASPRRLHLAAFHPSSTARAGSNPARFPADPAGGVRGLEGAWIADASILPTCATVNPQITIMALAAAVAEGIVERG